jgi:hypothetical protein
VVVSKSSAVEAPMTSGPHIEDLFAADSLTHIVESRLVTPQLKNTTSFASRLENYLPQHWAGRDIIDEIAVDDEIERLSRRGALQTYMDIEELRALTIEEIGRSMPEFVDGPTLYSVPPKYWAALKQEFRTLICTNDKKYLALKKKLEAVGTKSQLTVVSMIAVAISSHVGLAAGVLVPFCALCMIAAARLGKEAFCSMKDLEMTIGEPTQPSPQTAPNNRRPQK